MITPNTAPAYTRTARSSGERPRREASASAALLIVRVSYHAGADLGDSQAQRCHLLELRPLRGRERGQRLTHPGPQRRDRATPTAAAARMPRTSASSKSSSQDHVFLGREVAEERATATLRRPPLSAPRWWRTPARGTAAARVRMEARVRAFFRSRRPSWPEQAGICVTFPDSAPSRASSATSRCQPPASASAVAGWPTADRRAGTRRPAGPPRARSRRRSTA